MLLSTKSFSDPFLILGIVTSPIFVDPFPVNFTVLFSVISDVLLVLLTIGSLAAGEAFLVNFIPSFTTSFENLEILRAISFLLGQDSLHNIFCGSPFYRQHSGHSMTVDWSDPSYVASYK